MSAHWPYLKVGSPGTRPCDSSFLGIAIPVNITPRREAISLAGKNRAAHRHPFRAAFLAGSKEGTYLRVRELCGNIFAAPRLLRPGDAEPQQTSIALRINAVRTDLQKSRYMLIISDSYSRLFVICCQ